MPNTCPFSTDSSTPSLSTVTPVKDGLTLLLPDRILFLEAKLNSIEQKAKHINVATSLCFCFIISSMLVMASTARWSSKDAQWKKKEKQICDQKLIT
ncbi:hypothetical protein YC2023_008104 [Brassica napus]